MRNTHPIVVRGDIRDTVRLAEDLIRFRTVGDNTKELLRCMAFLKSRIRAWRPGMVVREYVQNGKPSLVITSRDTKSPHIFLGGHIDVLAASDKDFTPATRRGNLYGRGALDMKAGIAAGLMALRDACHERKNLDAGMIITSDEEVGGRDGMGFLLEEKGFRAKYGIMLEGGVQRRIVHRQKGVCQIKIIARGTATHGAYPWLGTNAAHLLIQSIERLMAMFPKQKDAWISTANLANITVPNTAVNRVPDLAEAIVDIRFTQDFAPTPEKAHAVIQKKLSDVEIHLLMGGALLDTDPGNSYVGLLRRMNEKISEIPLPLGFSHGASDARFFAARGIPCVEYGPTGGGHHGDKEYVKIATMHEVYRTLKEFLLASGKAGK